MKLPKRSSVVKVIFFAGLFCFGWWLWSWSPGEWAVPIAVGLIGTAVLGGIVILISLALIFTADLEDLPGPPCVRIEPPEETKTITLPKKGKRNA